MSKFTLLFKHAIVALLFLSSSVCLGMDGDEPTALTPRQQVHLTVDPDKRPSVETTPLVSGNDEVAESNALLSFRHAVEDMDPNNESVIFIYSEYRAPHTLVKDTDTRLFGKLSSCVRGAKILTIPVCSPLLPMCSGLVLLCARKIEETLGITNPRTQEKLENYIEGIVIATMIPIVTNWWMTLVESITSLCTKSAFSPTPGKNQRDDFSPHVFPVSGKHTAAKGALLIASLLQASVPAVLLFEKYDLYFHPYSFLVLPYLGSFYAGIYYMLGTDSLESMFCEYKYKRNTSKLNRTKREELQALVDSFIRTITDPNKNASDQEKLNKAVEDGYKLFKEESEELNDAQQSTTSSVERGGGGGSAFSKITALMIRIKNAQSIITSGSFFERSALQPFDTGSINREARREAFILQQSIESRPDPSFINDLSYGLSIALIALSLRGDSMTLTYQLTYALQQLHAPETLIQYAPPIAATLTGFMNFVQIKAHQENFKALFTLLSLQKRERRDFYYLRTALTCCSAMLGTVFALPNLVVGFDAYKTRFCLVPLTALCPPDPYAFSKKLEFIFLPAIRNASFYTYIFNSNLNAAFTALINGPLTLIAGPITRLAVKAKQITGPITRFVTWIGNSIAVEAKKTYLLTQAEKALNFFRWADEPTVDAFHAIVNAKKTE